MLLLLLVTQPLETWQLLPMLLLVRVTQVQARVSAMPQQLLPMESNWLQ
jgi:hypothetical protein